MSNRHWQGRFGLFETSIDVHVYITFGFAVFVYTFSRRIGYATTFISLCYFGGSTWVRLETMNDKFYYIGLAV